MFNKIQLITVVVLVALILVALIVLGVVIAETSREPTETASDSPDDNLPADKEEMPLYKIDIMPYEEAIFTRDARFMILVNGQHNIGTTVPDNIVDSKSAKAYSFSSYSIHEKALLALTAMCLEAKADGISTLDITSAYRSYDKQNSLFNSYCDREMKKDPTLSRSEAEAIVATYSCRPGTSEHQTGLAVDLRLKWDNKTLLEESFGDTEAGKWLAENCERFGFILRFPKDKTAITGIQYEPWHFRFVGYEAAMDMREKGMCLEEYIAYLDGLAE